MPALALSLTALPRTPHGRAVFVDADDVAATYPGALRPAIANVTFTLRAGDRVCLLGPNGGGKSTLIRVLTGELPASAGRLALHSGRVALVPQTERSRLDFPVSALDVALMGAVTRMPWYRRPGRTDRAMARAALGRVGLRELAETTFGDLSGGQRQRVLVARALVQDAPLLLLDEPFRGLDRASAERLTALLDELAAEGRGLLMASHDIEQARLWDQVLCLNGVQVAFGPPASTLTLQVIERTYGAAIVPLPGGGDARGILPSHHHDH